jgi:hypothetical protein
MTTRHPIPNLLARPAARTIRRPAHRTRLALEPLENRQLLATIVVTNATDTPAANEIDLRQAIGQAASGDMISFSASVFTGPTTITLGGSQLEINKNVTINGPTTGVTISGGNASRVFQVDSGVTATLSGLTITDCHVVLYGGGGLFNQGTVNLTNVTVSDNNALHGAGIDNVGTANLANVTISGNHTHSGGGLDNQGSANLTNVTISGNTAIQGGGVYNTGTAILTDVTISGNSAGFGAGLDNYGAADLTNVTISGNTGERGAGAMLAVGTANFTDVTISGNTASISGGGLSSYASATATLIDTIVAGQLGGGDITGGGTFSGNHNLIGDGTGQTGLVNGSNGNIVGTGANPIGPLLAPLGNYGGPTLTMPPLPRSPAIAAGVAADVSGTTTAITTDQRGMIRGAAVDIGAVQDSLVVRSVAGTVITTATGLTLPGAVSLADSFAGTAISFGSTIFATEKTITPAAPLTLSNTALSTSITGPTAGVVIDVGSADLRNFGSATLSGLTITGGLVSLGTATLTNVTINGSNSDQALDNESGTVTLTNVTISDTSGSGILNTGTANLTNVTISGGFGGLVNVSGTVNLNKVTISGTSGIANNGGTANLTNVTISDSGGDGLNNIGTANLTNVTVSGSSSAGIANYGGTANLTNVTISGNSGSGLLNRDTANLTNVTISGNSGSIAGGGGIANIGTANLTDVTISRNTNGGLFDVGSLSLIDTIVAGQLSGGDITAEGNFSGNNNLIGDGDGQTSLVNGSNSNIVGTGASPIDPLLALLGNYGGPTQTMALLPGSPAIAKGIGVSTISTDQRGAHRATSGAVDIGAFQDQGYTVAIVSGSGQSALVGTAFANPLVAVLTEKFAGSPIPGASLSFAAPTTGASATLSAGSATTDANGQANVTATANHTAGTYKVTAAATGVATKASFSLTNTAPILVSIAVTPTNPSVAKGLTKRFTATGTFNDGSTEILTSGVTWASSNTTTATITATGMATAKGTGTSTITATDGSISGTTILTVTAATLVSIAVTPANPSVAKGLTEQFTATGTFTDGSTQILTSGVTWASSNTTAATITTAGLASTLATGTSTIKATDGSVFGSTTLTVTPATLVSIAVTPTDPSISKGLTEQFTATGTFTDGTMQILASNVTWASSNTTAATITTTGLASALATGTSTIKATDGSVFGSTTLTVSPAALVAIAVTPTNPSISKGLTEQFTATGTFTDGTMQILTSGVTWASSNNTAATITTTGLASALAAGSSTIKATDGSVFGTTTLTVTAAALVSIAVTPANPSVAKGLTEQFTATGTFSDNTTANLTSSVTWTSSNTTAATISTAGLASTLATGSSTITATDGSVFGTTTLTVTPAATQAPTITSADGTTFVVGTPGAFTVTTTGLPVPGLTESGALPSGVTFVDNGNGTATLAGTPDPGTAGTYTLTITAANGVLPDASQTFTLLVNFQTVTVNGEVFNDLNGDGTIDPGDTGFSGWTVNLLNSHGVVTQTTTTNSSGGYSFTGVGAGAQTIQEIPQTGPGGVPYVPTVPSTGTIAINPTSAINQSGLNFGNVLQPEVVDVRVDWGSESISLLNLNRDLPFININAIDVIFNENVSVTSADLALTTLINSGNTYNFGSFSYNSMTHDATWTLPSAIGVDSLMLALDGVTGPAGIAVSALTQNFAVVPGDVNGDGVVDSLDMGVVRNQIVGAAAVTVWADADGTVDANGDPVVTMNDYNAVKKLLGSKLP